MDLELRASKRLIEIGLGELQNLNSCNDFHYLPFQLLASGFERFMKCHICYGHLELQGNYPSFTDLKAAGHNLLDLKQTILERYFQQNSPLLKDDFNYLKSDQDLYTVLEILSEFGKAARYYNLDIVTESNRPPRDVVSEWKAYETNIMDRDKKLVKMFFDAEQLELASQMITRTIIIQLERFVGAIARQFTLGKLGKEAQKHSYVVFEFISLYNDKLGQTDYRKKMTKHNNSDRGSHLRTAMDEDERMNREDFQHKIVTKEDYLKSHSGEWPFLVDSVIIECRQNNWCVVTIEGRDYALHGLAKSRYKLESPEDGGYAILGIGMRDFLDMAFELAK